MSGDLRSFCPVCGYPDLTEPAYDQHGCASFDICPSCGTEFGYDDAGRTHADLRERWVNTGAKWSSSTAKPPAGWDPVAQIRLAGLSTEHPASAPNAL